MVATELLVEVIELWTLPASELLTTGKVGLLPWVPLTQFTGSPAPVIKECRRQIDTHALAEERDNLLAVSQVLAQLRYNDPELLAILGGKKIMIESPLINEIVAEKIQAAVIDVLQARFGDVSKKIEQQLRAIQSEKKLKSLIKHAARCDSLQAFQERLAK